MVIKSIDICSKCHWNASNSGCEICSRCRCYLPGNRCYCTTVKPGHKCEMFISEDEFNKEWGSSSDDCQYCRGAKYTDKSFEVTTQSGNKVKTQFNYCPNCGRKLKED